MTGIVLVVILSVGTDSLTSARRSSAAGAASNLSHVSDTASRLYRSTGSITMANVATRLHLSPPRLMVLDRLPSGSWALSGRGGGVTLAVEFLSDDPSLRELNGLRVTAGSMERSSSFSASFAGPLRWLELRPGERAAQKVQFSDLAVGSYRDDDRSMLLSMRPTPNGLGPPSGLAEASLALSTTPDEPPWRSMSIRVSGVLVSGWSLSADLKLEVDDQTLPSLRRP